MTPLTAPEIALTAAAVLVGALVQGSIGFGFALVVAPAFTLIQPQAVPVAVLLLVAPLTIAMSLHERHAVDVHGLVWILIGRIPGTAIGVWLLTAVPVGSLSVMLGAMIVAAVAASVVHPGFTPRAMSRFIAGTASGALGTASSIGGPPLALLYQRRPGAELRSTLAVAFAAGLVLSLGGLAIAGEIHTWHALLAAELLPALVAGLVCARIAGRRLDEVWLRRAVLTFAAVSGAVAILRGLL